MFVLGLAWLTHLALDRAFGYGLRAKDGTRLTTVRLPVEPVSPA
ncbi:DUF4260 family protein [Actinotalea sp.]